MLLSESLRLGNKDVVAFTGAGGKTSALLQLAGELVAQGKRVVVTTTTRLFAAQAQAPNAVTLYYDPAQELGIGQALEGHKLVFAVCEREPRPPKSPRLKSDDTKVSGIPPSVVDAIAAREDLDVVLVEADGARMLPFKAPAAHEPVVPASTTVFVPVVGASVLGKSLDETHVHRPEIVARQAGARIGDRITPTLVARVLVHPEGGLKGKPPSAHAIALINQVETEEELESARQLARLLLGYDRAHLGDSFDAVAIGAVQTSASPVRETHRRAAAIVLAAGAGTRMGERVKQLLTWHGRTLVENAISIATQSSANETIVVLGSRAEQIRPLLRGLPVRVVLNPDWEEGHSTSVRAGLKAMGPQYDAAIFINADQPRLTPDIVNSIIQRYRETDASIVAPLYDGKRGSPVLFRRTHFAELMSLSGEQGGREVLMQHPVEYISIANAAASEDIDTPEDYERLGN